jgi:UV DNA damage repair endonuclease
MTVQEQQGLVENVIFLLETIKSKTLTETLEQETTLESLEKVHRENLINKTKLKYCIDKLNQLKPNIEKL